jgi:hypothetical protein
MKEYTENKLKFLSQRSEVLKRCERKLKQQGILDPNNDDQQNSIVSLSSTVAALPTGQNAAATATTTTSSSTTTAASSSVPTSAINTEDENVMFNNQLDDSNINNQSIIDNKFMKQVKHLNSEK